eukprot:761093_1
MSSLNDTVDTTTNRSIDPKTQLINSRLKQEKIKQQRLDAAIHIKEDLSLPTAAYIRIKDAKHYTNKRVEIRGYVQNNLRKMHSCLIFLDVIDDMQPDAFEFTIQCVFEGDICKTKEALTLTKRSLLTLRGLIVERDALEHTYELRVDYFENCDPSHFKVHQLSSNMPWLRRCQYLIDGYIREGKWRVIMVVDVKQMMQMFVGDIWNDEWDVDLKNKYIEIEGDTVTTTAPYGTMSQNTVFGTKIIYGWPWCQKYRWKIQLVHSNGYVPDIFGEYSENNQCCFGVIPAEHASDEMYQPFVSCGYDGYGYCHGNGYKCHHLGAENHGSGYKLSGYDAYGPRLKAGDIIEVELDLKHETLRYYVNGTDLGIAWDNLDRKWISSPKYGTRPKIQIGRYNGVERRTS